MIKKRLLIYFKGLRIEIKNRMLQCFIIYKYYSIKEIFCNLYRYGTLDMFTSVDIETTTYCNRRCSYCPNFFYERGLIQNKKIISDSLFKKIIDELSNLKFKGSIVPNFYGEPLLDNRLLEFVTYTRNKLPISEIIIYTNGDFLTVPYYIDLTNAGVTSFILSPHFGSLSGSALEVYEFQKDKNNNITLYYPLNQPLNNRAGNISLDNVTYFKNCTKPYKKITIDYSGNIILCCNDYFSTVKFGNIKTESIFKIWKNKDYSKTRKRILHGKFNLDICKKCGKELYCNNG